MIVAGLIALTLILTGIAVRVGVDRGTTTRVLTSSEPEPLLYAEFGAVGVAPAVPAFIAISMFTSLPAWAAPVTMVVLASGTVLMIHRGSMGRARPHGAVLSAHLPSWMTGHQIRDDASA